ncbi:hypothetical protein T01_934, partial [Trichinella spiralis]
LNCLDYRKRSVVLRKDSPHLKFELPGLPEAQCCPSQRFNTFKGDLLEARHYKAASAMILVL